MFNIIVLVLSFSVSDMSLPPTYLSSADYFKDALEFLKNHQWLYNYPNTHILVNDILNQIPCEWFQYFQDLSNSELNKLPINDLKSPPPSLRNFLNKIDQLKPELEVENCSDGENNFQFSHNCCLSEKKRHEIVILAPIINNICNDIEAQLVIDIGSGLGYLSHHLHSTFNHKVLGIECSKQYVEMSFKNQEKFYYSSKNKVNFTNHYITAESDKTIFSLVESNFDSVGLQSSCLVGLHACADLSVTVLDLFSKLEFVKGLVIMPCCYHRLQLKKQEIDKEYFHNFPASRIFKDLCNQFSSETFLKRPFLRLACQETSGNFIRMSQEEHEIHARNLMFRCILQFVADSEKCEVKRTKRKSNKSVDSIPEFEDYLNNLKNTHQLKPLSKMQVAVTDDTFKEKMRQTWKRYEKSCYLINLLTGLQASLQKMCENLILLDRVEYLNEKGYHARVQKVTNDMLSPRCYALICTKY